MIHKETLDFLKSLASNNNKSWFDEHKKDYQAARENFLDVIAELLASLSQFDEDIYNSGLDPKKCMFRINRDIRFSKDKSPYKTNFFAFMNRAGKKSPYGGFYLSIKPGESFTGGGIYMPESKVLQMIREKIDSEFNVWQSIAENKMLLKHFPEGVKASGSLKRPPKGYDDSNPAIDYLKFKGFYTYKSISDDELKNPSLVTEVMESFLAVQPLVQFINQAIV